jgi:hypothetical protein
MTYVKIRKIYFTEVKNIFYSENMHFISSIFLNISFISRSRLYNSINYLFSVGMNCIKEDKSSTEVKFEFFVYQKDDGFKFTSTANTFRKGQLVM